MKNAFYSQTVYKINRRIDLEWTDINEKHIDWIKFTSLYFVVGRALHADPNLLSVDSN